MEARAVPDTQKMLVDRHHCPSQGAYLYIRYCVWSSFITPVRKPNDPRKSARKEGAVINHGIIKPHLYLFLPLPLKTFA